MSKDMFWYAVAYIACLMFAIWWAFTQRDIPTFGGEIFIPLVPVIIWACEDIIKEWKIVIKKHGKM